MEDELLRRADKNPNRRGLVAILDALGVVHAPLDTCDPGGVEVLLVLGDQHTLTDETRGQLATIARTVVAGAHFGPMWEAATVWLPTRIHLEKTGSYTNFDGVVQRLDRAVRPASTCKSEGWYVLQLATFLGAELPDYRSPAEVFDGLAATVDDFAGMTHDALRPHGLRLGAGAGTDDPTGATPAAPSHAGSTR